MNPQGRTFLVTGGASGLGAATAQIIHSAGGNVVLADVNSTAGNRESQRLGQRARFVPTDVTDETSVRNAIDSAIKGFGGLNGVVNCAGILIARRTVGRHGAHDLESFSKIVHVNLIGTFNVVRLASEVMCENEPNEEGERGVIINTASIAAFDGQIGQVAYAASKAGVVGMTLPLARDLARHAIRVVTIAPGVFETPMMADIPEAARQALETQVPFPSRLGRPAEFGSLVLHAIQNPMINGEVIRIDGAIRMPPK